MAKTPKKQGFSIQGFDASHIQQTESYIKAIDALYNQAVAEYAKMAGKLNLDPLKPFSFGDYPGTKAKAEAIVLGLANKMQSVIVQGSEKQWLFACQKNDAFIASILDTSKVKKSTLSKFQDRNLDALKTFQSRKVSGLGLSDRIWNYAGQMKTQMEMGIDLALGDGKSANALSRDLKQYLVDPDKLFRRVRDKHGVLQLSKNAKAFHPGQGKYRSSYKNAMRLTRSEINMAYRESDHLRWKQLNFVIGFEVMLSNNHPVYDICDVVKGKYPKDFKFVGWHPQCRCKCIPILQDPKDFNTDELNELKAAINGTEYTPFQSANAINDVPKGFKDWIAENAERAKGWKSQPYFISDNFKGGNISGGLDIATSTIVGQTAEKAAKTLSLFDQNLQEIESILSLKRGVEMTFEDANELKGNINFSKGGGYRINCQSTVVTNEVRRRGFEVTAVQNTRQAGSIPYMLSRKTEMAWINPLTGATPIKEKAIARTVKLLSKALSEKVTEVGRYHIDFVWKGTRSGHIICLEKLENGNFRFYDPQNGKLVAWDDLSRQVSLKRGINILRIDNLLVNNKIVQGIMTKL
jgi:hypothetical protein